MNDTAHWKAFRVNIINIGLTKKTFLIQSCFSKATIFEHYHVVMYVCSLYTAIKHFLLIIT